MNRRALFLGALTAVSGAIAVVACGKGDDQSPNEMVPDGSTMADGTTDDAATPPDSGTTPDSATPDGGPTSDAGDAGACVLFDASGLDEASVAAGMAQVLQVYHCTSCHQRASQVIDAGHGVTLSGNNDGLRDSGTIFPPNLTNDPSTGLGCWTDPQIATAILTGVDNEGMALCPPMPKFGNPATTADGGLRPGFPMDAGTAQEIVDYLRSLPAVVNQVPDTTCPAPGGGDGGADASDAASE
jgi:hypothetical protein